MKATYGEITTNKMSGKSVEAREIFKDPITDDGTKKSKKGLLWIGVDEQDNLICKDQCTWLQESKGLLQTVFKDGKLIRETSLSEIRAKLKV